MTPSRRALLALALLGPAARQAAAELRGDAPLRLAVAVEGSLPGFRDAELPSYLAAQMAAARLPNLSFVAGPPDPADAPNRVLWSFKPNPFAGGTVRSIGSAGGGHFAEHRLVTVELRLYRGGNYQKLAFGEMRLRGGPADRDLAILVYKMTLSLLGSRDFD
jgi:hypothetical protein